MRGREPGKRASLDDIQQHPWMKSCSASVRFNIEDDSDRVRSKLSGDDHEAILRKMRVVGDSATAFVSVNSN